MHISSRLNICSNEIWNWGKYRVRNFQKQIDWCKKKLEGLRERTDGGEIREFGHVKRSYFRLLNQQHNYWKQRAKIHWLKSGDSNSKFYHDSVKRRKRNNQIEKFMNEEGNWVHKGPDCQKLVQDYFARLFTSSLVNQSEVLECIPTSITSRENTLLTKEHKSRGCQKSSFQYASR